MSLPKCPKCGSEYTYEDGNMLVCPECFHEWIVEEKSENEENVVKDANGNDDIIEILEEFKKQDDKIYHPVHILYFEFTQNFVHARFLQKSILIG